MSWSAKAGLNAIGIDDEAIGDLPGGFDVAYEYQPRAASGSAPPVRSPSRGLTSRSTRTCATTTRGRTRRSTPPKVTIAGTAMSLELDVENGERRAQPTYP
jgi:hypothetical protein